MKFRERSKRFSASAQSLAPEKSLFCQKLGERGCLIYFGTSLGSHGGDSAKQEPDRAGPRGHSRRSADDSMSCGSSRGVFPAVHSVSRRGMHTLLRACRVNRGRKRFPRAAAGPEPPGRLSPVRGEAPRAGVACGAVPVWSAGFLRVWSSRALLICPKAANCLLNDHGCLL